ncbi:MAG: hypothetical protein K8R90_09995 [Candidatus Cloacimonetes bacterium]|nr:hypothetical protein [Candidatus Cloacimonadota bacterium]
MKTEKRMLYISSVCFILVWTVDRFLISLFHLDSYPFLSIIISILASLGVYVFVFQLAIDVISKFTRRWEIGGNLSGEWYQIFQILNYPNDSNVVKTVRHGPVTISIHDSDIEISATNSKLIDEEPASSWHSNKVTIQGRQIWLLYSSTGHGRGTTHGHMLFHYQGIKPYKLIGDFYDSCPARHFGSIQLFRNKTEYFEVLSELKDRAE